MIDSILEALQLRFRALWSRSRVGQFVGVGLVGAAVDTLGLYLLVELTALGPVVGKAVSWELSIVVIFVINEWWTFASYGETTPRALGRRFLRSNVVRFAGFLVTLAVLAMLVRWAGVWYVAANAVGIGVGFFVNYTCESLYTWKVHQR